MEKLFARTILLSKKNGKQIIEINLPTFYSSKIKSNKWKISYEVLE